MAYSAFSTQKVFYNDLVNILCNKIVDRVNNQFPGSENKLMLNGDLSRMVQGDDIADLPVVSFVTSDAEIYKYLVLELETILAIQTQLSFKNRIQVVNIHAYFEFWHDAGAAAVAINNMYCRDYQEAYDAPVSPYNIPLADPQVFTGSAENDLYFQKWSVDKISPLKIFYMAGGDSPDEIDLNLVIENHFATEDTGKFNSFKAFAEVLVYSGDNENLILSGTDLVTAGGLDLTANNLEQVLHIAYQDLEITNPGTYKGLIRMWVNGVRADSGLTDRFISKLDIDVEFRVYSPSAVSGDISDMYFSHIRNSDSLPAQDLHIYTTKDFYLEIPKLFDVTGGNLELIDDDLYPNLKRYSGSGEQVISIATNSDFDVLANPTYINSLRIYDPNPGSFGGFPILSLPWTVKLNVNVRNAHGFSTEPASLNFLAIKNVESADAQELNVVSTQPFTVSVPYWLEVNPAAGNFQQILQVKPIVYTNLVQGVYEGNIVLTSADAEVEIPVVHTVVENISTGLLSTVNFTNDNLNESVIYSNDFNERASIDIDLTVYNINGVAENFLRNFKLAFSLNRTKLHIGDIVRKHIPLIEDPLLFLNAQLYQVFSYYKPANSHIKFNIENRVSGSSVLKKELRDVKFVSGRKPVNFQTNYGMLDFDGVPERVTVNSQILFNFYREFEKHDITIYKNANLIKTITHSPGNSSLFGLAMFFNETKPGDVIEIRLKKNEQESFIKRYVVFPEGLESAHIVWQDEYSVLRSYEFTGGFSVLSGYEFIESKTFDNLVEKVQNIESSKELSLVIDSGWILKPNQVIMDGIMRSKRSWFVKDGKIWDVKPMAKDLLNEDSEEDLFSYELKFKINRSNDLEVYNS